MFWFHPLIKPADFVRIIWPDEWMEQWMAGLLPSEASFTHLCISVSDGECVSGAFSWQ